jgi:hypothetical protein
MLCDKAEPNNTELVENHFIKDNYEFFETLSIAAPTQK